MVMMHLVSIGYNILHGRLLLVWKPLQKLTKMVRTTVATLGTNSKKLDQVVNTVQDLQVKVTAVEKNVTAVKANALKIQSQCREKLCVSAAPCQGPGDDLGKAVCY